MLSPEVADALAAGQPGWEVHVQLRWHRQAVELAERLQAEGHPVIRRWRYLVLGANNEDDASALAGAILTMLAEPELRARLGAAGRARILDRFTWRRTAEGMIENWYDTLEITDHGRRARMA